MGSLALALPSLRPAKGLSGSVTESVPETGGVRRSALWSVPGTPECPTSVPRVSSAECQKGVPDTLGTLAGHSVARGPGNISWDTPSDTPVFGDTLGDAPRDTRARRARETPIAGRRDRNSCAILMFA